jgi:putative transposase
VKHGAHVSGEDGIEYLVGLLCERRASLLHAGVVERDVEAPEALTSLDHRGAKLFRHDQNLLDRRFDGWAPNRAWTTDISYVLTDEGWLYLAAIVDLGTRRIVGWAMRERMSAKLVCDALQMAYWRRRPAPGLLMHSDRGSQYASDDYRKLLKQFHMTQSMSRKGNCWDNALMESFFKTLKVERTYRLQYTSRDQARLDIVNWIEGSYNEKRLHSAIDYRSAADFERSPKAA